MNFKKAKAWSKTPYLRFFCCPIQQLLGLSAFLSVLSDGKV
jgi:hypothetical protein